MKKVAGKKREKEHPIVLVGTYRPECWDFISKVRVYNLPFDDGNEEALRSFTHLVLFAKGKGGKAYVIHFSHFADKAWLKKHGYLISSTPHAKRYAIFALDSKSIPYGKLLSDKTAQVFVYSSRIKSCKIDDEFYSKPYPNVGGESMHDVFDKLKPYHKKPEKMVLADKSLMQLSFDSVLNPVADIPFPSPKSPKFTFIDLFAGIGGFRIAMQDCGGKCVFTSEFDPYAQKTYQANFGEIPAGDITKKETHNKIMGEFDVVCAGFPCQAFSLAGKRLGFNDLYKGMSRGTLFAEVVKICEKHHPKAVFCENVKGLFIHDKGNTFKVIKNEFESIGYKFFYKILNSKDFGVPQHRERIYMVAFRDDYAPKGYEFKFPKPTGRKSTLNDIREPKVSSRYFLSDVYLETLKRHKARHQAAGHGFGYVVRDWTGTSGAIVCGGMGRETNLVREENGTPKGLIPETHIKGSINKEGIRKMTPREWARLQGFPENFRFVLSDVHLYKQFGNTVSIPVIKAISKNIVDHIQNVEKHEMRMG